MAKAQHNRKFAPLERPRTLREAAVDILRDAILEGRYLPGDRIVETQVAQEFGISRAPLREAASALIEEGLLIKKPFSGYSVPTLSNSMVENLYATRTALESFAVEQCWDRRDDAFRRELDNRNSRLLETIRAGHQAAAIKAELNLHGVVYEWSGNDLLQTFWRMTQGQLQLYWSAHQRAHNRYGPLGNAHDSYVALAKGDDKAAMLAEITSHMQRGLNTIRRELDMVEQLERTSA